MSLQKLTKSMFFLSFHQSNSPEEDKSLRGAPPPESFRARLSSGGLEGGSTVWRHSNHGGICIYSTRSSRDIYSTKPEPPDFKTAPRGLPCAGWLTHQGHTVAATILLSARGIAGFFGRIEETLLKTGSLYTSCAFYWVCPHV